MNEINVSKRDLNAKAKKLRREGLVPATVCGGNFKESVAVTVTQADAVKLLATHNIGSRLDIILDGKKVPVQLKEKSLDPMGKEIYNISFQALKADQKVKSVAHVVLLNTDKVTAILEQMMMDIPYSSLPRYMIDTIEVDVDGMGAGTTVTVGDIKELQSENLELHADNDEIVFRIVESIKGKAEAEEAEEEEKAE